MWATASASEVSAGFEGRLSDVSMTEVRDRLAPRTDVGRFVAGDVFETLPKTETGPLAFAHLDMNASAPSKLALEYVWSRLVQGGMIVFDDYGFAQYADQQKLIDDFFEDKPDGLMALATGQALSVKL